MNLLFIVNLVQLCGLNVWHWLSMKYFGIWPARNDKSVVEVLSGRHKQWQSWYAPICIRIWMNMWFDYWIREASKRWPISGVSKRRNWCKSWISTVNTTTFIPNLGHISSIWFDSIRFAFVFVHQKSLGCSLWHRTDQRTGLLQQLDVPSGTFTNSHQRVSSFQKLSISIKFATISSDSTKSCTEVWLWEVWLIFVDRQMLAKRNCVHR